MMHTRRRFLTLTSAACLGAALPARAYRWQGTALGARAQIILDHPKAAQISQIARAEIARLEGIFSLFDATSEVARLNRQGHISSPSFELLDCLATARHVHRITQGAFDPTVQPMWQVLARGYSNGAAPDLHELEVARATIGFEKLRFDASGIKLSEGQAITLNGIAQGYIADRVARLMTEAGIKDVLIDTGEILALGQYQDTGGWPVTIDKSTKRLRLSDRAIATSETLGTVFDRDGRQGHILPPRAGQTPKAVQVSVSAPNAALADALSTGLCLASSEKEAMAMIGPLDDVRLENFASV